jgi:hypothetical protein
VKLLPQIQEQARFAFRSERAEAREELIQEVTVHACLAYARLVELDKEDLAYATPLVRYAVAQIRTGRRVGCSLNVKDVTSDYCQQKKGIVVERLDRYDEQEDEWREIVIEDRHCGPAEIAVTRIDFQSWLKSLSPRDRRIAQRLAAGESTRRVAKLYRLSAARISQLRRELQEAWEEFQGLTVSPA